MRKGTLILLSLLLLVFVGVLLATQWLQGSVEADLGRSRELTDLLHHRGALREGTSALTLLRRGGGARRLADEGSGVLIELAPAPEILARRGALEEVVRRACQEFASTLPPGTPLDWFELRLQLDGSKDGAEFATLLRRSEDGALLDPDPPLPLLWPLPGAAGPLTQPTGKGSG